LLLSVAIDIDEGTFLYLLLACARLHLAVQRLSFLAALSTLSLLILVLLRLVPHACSVGDLLSLKLLLLDVLKTARPLIRNFLQAFASALIFMVILSLFLLHSPHMLVHILVQYVGSLMF